MKDTKLDLIGKRFGKLVVLKRQPSLNNRNSYWTCKCDCGKFRIVRGTHLTHKNTTSCGCSRRSPFGEQTKKSAWANFKDSARRRGYKVIISYKDWHLLTQNNCYYCNTPPSNLVKSHYNNGDFIYNGIDRLDNTKNYTKENCVPCCTKCNVAKLDMTEREFIEWVKKTYLSLMNKKKF